MLYFSSILISSLIMKPFYFRILYHDAMIMEASNRTDNTDIKRINCEYRITSSINSYIIH